MRYIQAIEDRDNAIVAMRKSGKKLDYLAIFFGKSRQGIAHIYKQKTGEESTVEGKTLDKKVDSVYDRV